MVVDVTGGGRTMCGRDSDREGRPSPPFTRPPSSRPKDLARSPIFHGPSAQRPGVGARGVMSVTVFHNRYLLFASPPPHLANIPHFPGPVLPTLSPCVPPPPPGLLTSPFPFSPPLFTTTSTCLFIRPHRQAPMFICLGPWYIFSISGEIYFSSLMAWFHLLFSFCLAQKGKRGDERGTGRGWLKRLILGKYFRIIYVSINVILIETRLRVEQYIKGG